jgi:hypothetical protein
LVALVHQMQRPFLHNGPSKTNDCEHRVDAVGGARYSDARPWLPGLKLCAVPAQHSAGSSGQREATGWPQESSSPPIGTLRYLHFITLTLDYPHTGLVPTRRLSAVAGRVSR